MFVASLNLDLFFKKVFSNKWIAKKYLEDVLGIHISEIALLAVEHKISDDSVIIKFDFRCKINGKYVVIEMQQKHKPDVNKRFYLYHCVGTALQLETLEPITITKPNGETYTEKDYSGLEPVLTLVWMVDDCLKFKDDFIAFSTLPEAAKNFITDDALWQQPLDVIEKERTAVLKILNNKTKDLDFFSKNRIIYFFQKNIVRNKKNTDYFKWFYFAETSKNPNNVESDFDIFKNIKVMVDVMKRLRKDALSPEENNYLRNLPDYEGAFAVQVELKVRQNDKAWAAKLERQKKRSDKNELLLKREYAKKLQAEQAKLKAEQAKTQAKLQAEQAKLQAEQAKLQAEQAKMLKAVKAFLALDKDIPTIADILELSIEEITALVKEIQDKEVQK